jgi:HAE1 family hydrophobic/amphiphilic exporter-1
MAGVAHQIDEQIRKNPEVTQVTVTVGSRDGSANKAQAFIQLVDSKLRKENTSQFKDKIREQLKPFAYANPKVKDIDYVGGGQRPFNLNIVGPDLDKLEKYGQMAFEKLKTNDALKDPDISYRPGKPEWQVRIDTHKAEQLGVSSVVLGQEIRSQLEGAVPAVFREKGEEYDIRVRLQEDQRNLNQTFKTARVPNINGSLIRLDSVAELVKTTGLSNIDRQDRGRFIQISADITPGGRGIGGAMTDVNQMFANEIKLPEGMRFSFEGQAENFKELLTSMVTAAGLGILFIYLVLASLYESFVIPFTIMLVLPLAACGAFIALLITRQSLDLFSMIGCIMLLGVATKNSILLVDYANQQLALGKSRYDAMLAAGKTRLRPILMTSFALIAGMIPLAMGLNEASKQRKSLGIAVIGGIVSSTLLTLVVVPAAFSYIDRFRNWLRGIFSRIQPQENRDTP